MALCERVSLRYVSRRHVGEEVRRRMEEKERKKERKI